MWLAHNAREKVGHKNDYCVFKILFITHHQLRLWEFEIYTKI